MISNVVLAIEDDIRCLKGIKAAFTDPLGILESWDFHNSSVGLICKLSGVSCWNGKEDRLMSVSLPSNELSGQIPDSLQYCVSLQILDLSDNKISGTIPPQICIWLPYLTTLDLSENQLCGSIPSTLANCTYLNKLKLSNNRLSGQIPYELASLFRLTDFNVANNDLSGEIPFNSSTFSPAAFEGNTGLYYGQPLSDQRVPFSGCEKNDGLCWLMVYTAVVLGFIVGFWGLFFVLLIKKEKWWFGYSSFGDTIASGFKIGSRAPVFIIPNAVHNSEEDDHQVFVLGK
ncbi:hypothetical protein MKX03_001635 [Papaver bracteatum]|nr:hypothetical protein MKX03_001635 [Papaver bracteatum]